MGLVHLENFVGFFDRCHAMGDDDNGHVPTVFQFVNGLFDKIFRLRIQGARGFVQDQSFVSGLPITSTHDHPRRYRSHAQAF